MVSRKMLFPIVAADVALFTVMGGELRIMLVERALEPKSGYLALPGAILDPSIDLTIRDTARRALKARLSGVDDIYLEQFRVFSGPDRDPRGYSVSIAFYALLPLDHALGVDPVANGRARDLLMPRVSALPSNIAFDHREIINQAATCLREKVERLALPLHLLPKAFTLTQLQAVCEVILGKKLDKGSFRRRLKDDGDLVPLPNQFALGAYRPAQLYKARAGYTF